MKGKLRCSWLVFSLCLVMALVVSSAGLAQEIIILHTNDVHGRLEAHIPRGAENPQGGLLRLASLVQDMRDRYGDNVLLLDAGDAIHGTNVVNLFDGIPAIEVMNKMGYDAMVLGNHEFNYGQAVVQERMNDADFPVLGGNVLYDDGSVFAYSAFIKEVNGVRIGMIGLVAEDTPIKTHPNNVKGLNFRDPVEFGQRLAERLRPDVDLLIGLTHIGFSVDEELALAAPEFDLIIGGHSHTTLEAVQDVGGVLVVQANEYGNYLGYLRIVLEDGSIVEYDRQLLPVTHETPQNHDVGRILASWNQLLQDQLSVVVGNLAVDMDGERASVRTKETNLGNLVADVMRYSADADIALANGGGIRASMQAGDINVGDIYTVLPFDNTLVVLEATGQDIIDALEHSVSLYPAEHGAFLQTSGLTYELHAQGWVGSRVTNIEVNGEPLKYNKVYRVATNDFLAVGGDGYEMFVDAPVVADTGLMLRDVMVDYFQQHVVVGDIELNRIVVVD